jgi:hypothetical protein
VTQVLTFNNGIAHKRLTKRVPEKYLDSVLRPNIEQGEGIRPSQIFIPHRSLPVKFEDRSTGQYVVIPKGRIVTILTMKNSVGSVDSGASDFDGDAIRINQDTSYYGISRNTLGMIVPANGGAAYTATYAAADLLAEVPDASQDAGSEANVTVGGTMVITANAPIGVMYKDVFQDIRGQYLNYETFKNYGILTQGHLAIPFIDVKVAADMADVAQTMFQPKNFDFDLTGVVAHDAAAADLTGANPALAGDNSATHITITDTAHGLIAGDVIVISGAVDGGDDLAATLNGSQTVVTVIDADNFVLEIADADVTALTGTIIWARADAAATGAGYAAVESYFSFLTLNSANAAHAVSGAFLTADYFGNYIPQYKTLSSNYKTVQTVGRILGLDSRFPKDLLETVESQRWNPNVLGRAAGTESEGLSEHLFWFAYRALQGAGYSWPTDGTDPAKKIVAMVKAGAFGMAHIQLCIK